VERFNDTASQLEDLIVQSEAEKAACEERLSRVGEEFEQALMRIEQALERVEELLATRTEGVLADLLQLDGAMREDVLTLTAIKVYGC
jgi:hypothetical protein